MKLLHLLLFVYWLGADAGTYYASRFVADPKLPSTARAVAAKIMLGIDLAPRFAMPLTWATGVHLAVGLGLLPPWALLAGWAGGLLWLAMVAAIHHGHAAALVRVDFGFRVFVAAALALLAASALAGGAPGWPLWLAIKVLAFAGTVACGLMIRVRLRPFGPAYAQLLRDGPSAEGDAAIASSIARCKPYVLLIWALLVLCAAAGLHLIG